MVVWQTVALRAVSGLVRTGTDTPKARKRCRAELLETVAALRSEGQEGAQAAQLIRSECWSCAKCKGI